VEERPEPRHRRVAVLLVVALHLLLDDFFSSGAAFRVVIQLQTACIPWP
jgi:hypothetical protein